MTLRPCYRATCDAPECTSVEMLPDERAGDARARLASLGWNIFDYYISASGAARIGYACPLHRDWRPSDDGRRLSTMAALERRDLSIRRCAMLWMLREAGAAGVDLAPIVGVTPARVNELARKYEDILERRMLNDDTWREPWAQRLRAAGAIP